MPKNVKSEKVGNNCMKRTTPPSKMRIGTRKNGKSANLMSNVDLLATLEDANLKRSHSKARAVLTARGAV